MTKTARLWISWTDRYGQPPKTVEQLTRDKRRVKEILTQAGCGHLFDEEHGLELDVKVESQEFNILIQELQKDPHLVPPGGLYIWQPCSRQNLESAKLLIWSPTNQAIEDDYYDFDYYDPSKTGRERDTAGVGPSFERCSACNTSLKQRRDLVVNKRLMRGKDSSLTYANQAILSERVGRLLQEHDLAGFELRPVQHYRKPYQNEPTLSQLVVTNVLPPMAAPPTEFEQLLDCTVCGHKSRYLKHTHWWGKIQYREDTDIYYRRSILAAIKDFNHTAEYFGELRVAHPYVIITQRVYRLLRERRVKNWTVAPVHLVE
ncbi:MAG: hypothetical protein WAV74_22920 [Anaerolineae bacterium]